VLDKLSAKGTKKALDANSEAAPGDTVPELHNSSGRIWMNGIQQRS
jgi:hypothetical protein